MIKVEMTAYATPGGVVVICSRGDNVLAGFLTCENAMKMSAELDRVALLGWKTKDVTVTNEDVEKLLVEARQAATEAVLPAEEA